ncbi:hypothetical protein [Pelosinus sp. UFO1]|uniref:hypothetical protein n=1 Tax=Pelosinus sp. UFO1 TaxID=484770 RepID=UPI0004D1879D|nr:hypothetical protein [Pelosinus sp. UFO1]AIF51281.1 hypothetical protein UFO1_1730 [Pelosinus sp. UFO1]
MACINNVIGYVRHLEIAISEHDLIGMRRANAERYIAAFRECADRVKKLYQIEEEE